MTLANKLTCVRLVAVPLVAASVALTPTYAWLRFAAMGLLFASALTDAVDGMVARAWRQKTHLGMFLDPLADKLLVNVTMVFAAVTPPFNNVIPMWVPPVVLARDVLMVLGSYVATRVSNQRVFRPRALGKLTAALQMASVLGAVVMTETRFETFAAVVTYVMVAFTAISFIDYMVRGSRLALAQKPAR